MVKRTRRAVVVVLGSLQMDLIGLTSRLPGPGETLRAKDFYTSPGGKGANQAVAAARLGAEVRMIGRVGKDFFGTSLLDNCRANGVDVSGVNVDEELSSGVSIILIDELQENYITAAYGANLACGDKELHTVKSALDGADALLLQLEIPSKVSIAAAHFANQKGVSVIWDTAPVDEMSPDVYLTADIVTPNQIETHFLTGIEVIDITTGLQAAHELVLKGAKFAIVKMAEMGACYASRTDSGYVPAYRIETIDTVAAGDAFGAGISVAIGEGMDMNQAMRFGTAAGALAVTRQGSQDAMPNRKEVNSLLSVNSNDALL